MVVVLEEDIWLNRWKLLDILFLNEKHFDMKQLVRTTTSSRRQTGDFILIPKCSNGNCDVFYGGRIVWEVVHRTTTDRQTTPSIQPSIRFLEQYVARICTHSSKMKMNGVGKKRPVTLCGLKKRDLSLTMLNNVVFKYIIYYLVWQFISFLHTHRLDGCFQLKLWYLTTQRAEIKCINNTTQIYN